MKQEEVTGKDKEDSGEMKWSERWFKWRKEKQHEVNGSQRPNNNRDKHVKEELNMWR